MAEPRRERFHPRDAIRVGLKIHPLTDLYYQLMRGPWWFLVVALVAFYLLANVAFASLYMADMPGISQAENGGFAQAFAFSVQTISTIGYGGMSPQTPYVHALVTAEAMVGVLGFAIATGLMFQKFSRATAMVRFSESIVLTVRDGKPVLMLRLGNVRGNEIIEASLRLTMLKPEVTAEGHSMRRLYDCDLMRTHTPIFVMTWAVVHEIDASSPMYGMTPELLAEQDALFIVTMTGIDATFSETVYARKMYYSESVRWAQRFEDVVSFNEEGRGVIDYTRFDATVADPAEYDVRALLAAQNTT
ncbi:MAG: hypothetical protein JKY37_12695 [Nannocystaceae bacterium]|nr:hypothetical protein [Nannocystaceae bacterium]